MRYVIALNNAAHYQHDNAVEVFYEILTEIVPTNFRAKIDLHYELFLCGAHGALHLIDQFTIPKK